MISSKEAVYQFKLQYDKLDSQDAPKLELPQILIILNKAQNILVKQYFSPYNPIHKGFENTEKRIDDLQFLVVKDEPLLIPQPGNVTNEFFVDISNLIKGTYLYYIRSYSIADKGECKDISLAHFQATHNELSDILITKDPTRYPSFEYQDIPIVTAQDKLWIYTDGSFTLRGVKFEYLKEPIRFDVQGYTHFDGTPSINQNSVLPDYLQEDVVTLAVKIAKAIDQDTSGFEMQNNLVQSTQE